MDPSCHVRFLATLIAVIVCAYSIGAQYGPAVLNGNRQQGDWKVYWTWQEVQQESVLTPIAQDDFQRATNFRGQWLGLDVFPWDNVEVRFWLLSNKPILPIDRFSNVDLANGSNETEWRVRLDMTAYF